MASGTENSLGEFIDHFKRFVNNQNRNHLTNGIVTEVNEFSCTVTIQDVEFKEVPFSLWLNALTGVYFKPKQNAECLIDFRDNDNTKAQIVLCSDYEEIKISCYENILKIDKDNIILNDGSFGGLVKVEELKTQLEKTNNVLNSILNIINGNPIAEAGNGAPSALQIALKAAVVGKQVGDYSNIENEKIKHGE